MSLTLPLHIVAYSPSILLYLSILSFFFALFLSYTFFQLFLISLSLSLSRYVTLLEVISLSHSLSVSHSLPLSVCRILRLFSSLFRSLFCVCVSLFVVCILFLDSIFLYSKLGPSRPVVGTFAAASFISSYQTRPARHQTSLLQKIFLIENRSNRFFQSNSFLGIGMVVAK